MGEEFMGGEGGDFAYYSKLIDRQRRDMDTVQLEQRTGHPPVAVRIIYGPHVSAAHIEPIKEELTTADVYIPELGI